VNVRKEQKERNSEKMGGRGGRVGGEGGGGGGGWVEIDLSEENKRLLFEVIVIERIIGGVGMPLKL